MKFYQKRGFALVVLVLAILGSCVYGISKKPADLPQVSYGNWLRDDADLLTDETEASLRQYDQSWDSDYRAIIAVATLDTLNGWTYEKAAAELGSQWGLGGNDMLLLLVKDSDYYVALGDNVLDAMTDTYQAGLQGAVETPYYQGDYDAAALAFFRQADVFYAQTLGRQQSGGSYSDYEDNGAWQGNDSGSVAAVVLLVVGIFVVWILLDGLRYRRYRRRPLWWVPRRSTSIPKPVRSRWWTMPPLWTVVRLSTRLWPGCRPRAVLYKASAWRSMRTSGTMRMGA